MWIKYRLGATTQYGYEFKEGEATEVTDPRAIGKLSSNIMFEVVDAEGQEEPYLIDEPLETEREAPPRRGGWPKGKSRKVTS